MKGDGGRQVASHQSEGVKYMCLRNLFCGSDCNWILLIIIVLLLIDEGEGGCGCHATTYPAGNGCGCGCGC